MLAMRASIIRHTADIFDPDLFIVDKEPLGLRGEVLETLQLLKSRGTPLVLGLRDVMDEPSALAPEWERKKVLPALDKLYDELWVYGLPQICDPLEGIKVPPSVRRKMVYTGYLERSAPVNADLPEMPEDPFILVTPGGGGDGEDMVDWVLRAYESDPNLPHRALIVLGPFMNRELQNEFLARAAALPRVEALTFESQLESLMSKAAGRRRHGRLQHLLRDPVVRQEGADRAAHGAKAGTVHPRQPRAGAWAGQHAARRRRPRRPRHGDGAPPVAAAAGPQRRDHSGPAGRAGKRQPAGRTPPVGTAPAGAPPHVPPTGLNSCPYASS